MEIIGRNSWGADPAGPMMTQDKRNVRELFIHWPGGEPASWQHVNTPGEERATMRSIQAFHMGPERGWSDFAYHFGAFQSGRIYRGRLARFVPAAQLNHNANTFAVVCFVGPNDKPSDELKAALRRLVHHCEGETRHELRVLGHSQGAGQSTECPGPRLRAIVAELDRV